MNKGNKPQSKRLLSILAALIIALLLPAWAARGGFGALLLANGFVLWKKALPTYKKSFSDTETRA